MFARVYTGAIQGLDGRKIAVEVDLTSGIPGLTIVGLPDTAVNESKERVKSAVKNSGFEFPLKKVVINLAPADSKKEGTGFDLPLALGILLASETLQVTPFLEHACFIGEVSLEGSIRGIHGVLAIAMMAKAEGFKYLVVPSENAQEASLVEGIEVFGLPHLKDLPVFLIHPYSYAKQVDKALLTAQMTQPRKNLPDFKDVKGQLQAKRALEIAAAGGHNILMVGPPGSGKSLLSKSFPSILPPLSFEEMLEVSRIYSVSGLLNKDKSLVDERPFRAPHHSASPAGITGGGGNPRPGEMTLAHRGVLFLDELVEFPRAVLEVLRQPLENGDITISRAQQSVTFPAKFLFLSAMNPCPCGYKGDAGRTCTCSEVQIQRYVSKLSGPLLDRIDIHIEVPRLSSEELLPFQQETPNSEPQGSASNASPESSETIRNRVIQARTLQTQRFQGTSVLCNGEMTPVHIKQFCQMDGPSQELLKRAVQRMNLSARSMDRILKLARTIADLAIVSDTSRQTISPTLESNNLEIPQNQEIQSHHLAEALQYRTMERLYQKSLQPV